ncbi:hypothetical protein LX15_000464 [Streptoalloteichus tenebrarius]|uniref:Transmembrane protein n=2 Tax=Streptoalloteichus tenebrarius (strain ATCC 17920 / DSM 40477 / JCM 4838 / CBS 697.72 / NBRC 16177 / NCIMB 11028 / NRRL B-12390 / A12253. 1 / ISP 5477) TaxID=1933 RepID=A0ABT1HMP4_STRSD|nr:hypothetical protein [Streptoalloteichus tenebrarius]BFF00314.1 membrane protein [Streptoalloteichus tenebrarius]
MARLRAEIDAVERGVLRHVEPGPKALLVTVCVVGLLVAAILPWVGDTTGWQVVLGHSAPGQRIHLLPVLFSGAAYLLGGLLSVLTLATRRWALAWASAWGCALSTVLGALAVWTQQTGRVHDPGPGPGAGLIVAVAALFLLTIQWFRIASSRPLR